MSDKSRNTNNQEYVGHISTEHNLSNIYDYCIEMCSIINKYLSITHTYALLHSKSGRSGTHSTVIFLNSPFIKKKSQRQVLFCFVFHCVLWNDFLGEALFGVSLFNWMTLVNGDSTIYPTASAGSSFKKKKKKKLVTFSRIYCYICDLLCTFFDGGSFLMSHANSDSS